MSTKPRETTLLCERCGYVLEGIEDEAHCPECGESIPMSRPETGRPGSPWQQTGRSRSSLVAFLRTNLGVLRHPMTHSRSLVIEAPRSEQLGVFNSLVASVLLGPVVVMSVLGIGPEAVGDMLSRYPTGLAVLAILGMSVGSGVLLGFLPLRALIMIESWGVRFFGSRRGWRVTPAVASAVCGHATIGWIIGSVLALLGWFLSGSHHSWNDWLTWPISARHDWRAAPWPAAGGFLAGLLIFETLVYFGIRQCRFGNPPRTPGVGEDGPPTGRPVLGAAADPPA
ncbi:MAG: hypothetical protein KF745_00990 [Phycisphaeraceae bacterium]|nr:hypothetical protein [Phycisphaeraceae bacterium]